MKKLISLALALVMICAMATTAFAADEGDAQNVQTDETTKYTIYTTEDGANASTDANTWEIDVKANENIVEVTNAQVAANYYVIVEWEVDSTLTYVIDEESYTWNVWAEDGTTLADADNAAGKAGYTSDGGTWVGTASVKVDVTNWSNKAVKANISFAAATKGDANGVTEDIEATWNVEDGEANTAYDLTVASPAGDANAKVSNDVYDDVTPGSATLNITKINDGAINADDVTIGKVTVKLTDADGNALTNYIQQKDTTTESTN